jgi:hypothetical protein
MTESLFITKDGVQFWSSDFDGTPEVRFAVMPPLRPVLEPDEPRQLDVSIRSFYRQIVEVDLGPIGSEVIARSRWTLRRENPDLDDDLIGRLIDRTLRPPRRVLRWFEYREAGIAGTPLVAWEIEARRRTWREVQALERDLSSSNRCAILMG